MSGSGYKINMRNRRYDWHPIATRRRRGVRVSMPLVVLLLIIVVLLLIF